MTPVAAWIRPEGPRARWTRAGYALLSAIGMVVSCPTYGWWWLAFVAWIPWFAAIDGLRPRGALFYGWVTGCITVFWGFFWMTELLTRFADFPMWLATIVAFLFAAYHGLLWGLAAMLFTVVSSRRKAPIWVLGPLAWVAIESTLPNIFPIHMGLAWCWQPTWIQLAEVGSVTTVAAVMVAINAAAYECLRTYATHRTSHRSSAIALAVLLVGVPTYGTIRIRQVQGQMDAAPKLQIGVVQGNMSIAEMGDGRHRARILREQQRVSGELEAQGADLLLWGETSYPHGHMFFFQSSHEPGKGSRWRVHRGFDAPVLIGTVTRDIHREEPYPRNSAVLLDGDGKVEAIYDKVYRLIFGEYIPLVDPEWYLDMVPSASHIGQGEGPKAIAFGEYRLGPLICYEDILPGFARDTAVQGVHVFLNLTNDAWFGDTAEPMQHLGLAVFRAVEHRKALLRAVNTGVSAYVDPTGRTLHRTRVSDPDRDGPRPAEGFLVDVPMMDPASRTPFGRFGDAFNVLCILALVGITVRREVPPPRA